MRPWPTCTVLASATPALVLATARAANGNRTFGPRRSLVGRPQLFAKLYGVAPDGSRTLVKDLVSVLVSAYASRMSPSPASR